MDATPGAGDLYYNGGWHSWLVGGLGPGGNLAVSFSSAPSGTSATLTSPFTGTTGTYGLRFSDAESRSATFTNNPTSVSWSGSLTGSPTTDAVVTVGAIYALDVTDPSPASFAEANAANLVKGESTLKDGTFTKIAIANPAAAPYGTAAIEAMKALKVYDALQPKIVQGNTIAQTFQFVETGNAELGFVALSQVIERKEGSRWLVSNNLYSPIKQDAVLLKKGADSEAAKAFLQFLKGPEAAAVETKFGYGTPESN